MNENLKVGTTSVEERDSLDVLMSDPAMVSEEEKINAWYNVFIQGLKKFRDQGLEVEKKSNIVRLSRENLENGSPKLMSIYLFTDGRPIKVSSDLQEGFMEFQSNETEKVEELINQYFFPDTLKS